MKTRAAIMVEHNQPVVVEEIDLDPPREGEVLMRMEAVGVCHSDLSVITGTIFYDQPTVIGHEGAGTIMELGPGVKGLETGQRVMLSFIHPCGSCYHCTRGRPNICDLHWRGAPRGMLQDGTTRFHRNGQPVLQMSRTGAMSEYIVVSEKAVIPFRGEPPPPEQIALIGCSVMTGVGEVTNTARVEVGSSVAVIGVGGVGINVIQGARLAGAGKIIAVDLNSDRLNWAKDFGATHTVNGSEGDAVEQVMALTDMNGVDYSFEAIGNAQAMADGFSMLRNGGALVVIGISSPKSMLTIPAQLFPFGERRILGCMYGSSRMSIDMPALLDLYRDGRLKLDELVSRTWKLDQINEAFDDLKSGRGLRGVVRFES